MVAGKEMHSSNISSNSNTISSSSSNISSSNISSSNSRLGELDKKSKTMQTTRSGQEATIDF